MVRREKNNYVIQSVSHALDVLEQFAGEHDELGVTELSKRLKLHKNNVFRLLATLEARGYIEQNKATENYRLGVRCLRLGQRFVSQLGILRQARPVMKQIAQASRETAFIALLRNGSIVPLDAVEPEQAVRLVSRIGDPLPPHCTAVGKLLLAFADDELRNSLPDSLQKFTDKTITDRQVLSQQLSKIAENSYALELGEYIEDVRSIAIAVRDYTGAVVGSVAIAGPAYRLSHERIEKEIIPLMINAGRDLSSRLGFDAA
ncbi:MAG: IclR family transcriptional regulator [Deltaproteobacteria bacterium]|nr:IclR family transcriptional regulator [Deltaproteobacteria bacterium]